MDFYKVFVPTATIQSYRGSSCHSEPYDLHTQCYSWPSCSPLLLTLPGGCSWKVGVSGEPKEHPSPQKHQVRHPSVIYKGGGLHFLIPRYHAGLPLNLISQFHAVQQNQASRHELSYGFKSAVARFTFSLWIAFFFRISASSAAFFAFMYSSLLFCRT